MLKFVKVHGTGNDFVLVDARNLKRDWPELARELCNRRYGVGADGVLLLLASQRADLRMRIFNPDGSEAEMCGNGIRCFTKYALECDLLERSREVANIETLAGIHTVTPFWKDGRVVSVKVGMGVPRLRPEEIPVDLSHGQDHPRQTDNLLDYPFKVGEKELRITGLSMGNPHAVCFLDGPVEAFPLEHLGPLVEHHPLFPERVNFEVAQVRDRAHIKARVWERGAGATQACGSGGAAVAVAARLHGFIAQTVEVELPGGVLKLEWDGEGEVWLTGPAEQVFAGEWPG